ncbi:MAG: hypothetical protein R3E97_03660 [Candidatus Eisenbacteria bacterium]
MLQSDAAHFAVLDVHPEAIQAMLRDWNMRLESFALLAHGASRTSTSNRPASDHLLERFAGRSSLRPREDSTA